MSAPLKIEVWSDVQCVWCYVGDARVKRAVETFQGQVEVAHRSYELQPGFPVDFDAAEYLQANRGMDAAAQDRVFSAMRATAAAEGLEYEPTLIKPTNSHLALQLLHHAETIGLRRELSDRLYAAYFAEGRHIGTIDSLVELAASVGLNADAARSALEAGTYRDLVDRDAAAALRLGARGAPFMVINDKYVIPGALDSDELVRILNQVAAE